MRLKKDFGVRALLMVLIVAPVSFGIVFCVVVRDAELLKTLLASTGGMTGGVIAFYLGTRAVGSQGKEETGTVNGAGDASKGNGSNRTGGNNA